MQSLSTLVKDFLSQSNVIFMPQQQYVRGQANLPLSIRTYKILWYTAVRLFLRSHVVWFPHIWGKTVIFLFPAWNSGKGKTREKPLKCVYSLHCSLFYHSFSSLDQPVLQRIIRSIDIETNDFGASIERVKQTVNYVSYVHVCKIRLFKGILNNSDHWVVCVQRLVYLYQEQALTILNCCIF
jgi:hypothetical protein